MQDIEEIEELYQKIPQSIIAQFFTNLEAYATGQTEMYIPTDFTEKTLDELIKNLLQEQVEQAILKRIGFQFLIDGKLLRGKLKSHLVRYSISCEQTLRIEYVLGFGEMSQNQEKEEDDWIGAIAEIMGVSSNKLAVGLFSGGISLYGDDNLQLSNFAADKDAISCIKVLPASHEDEYFSIYGGIDEQIRVQLISFNKEKVQNQLVSENDHEGSLLGLDVNPALDGLICSVGSSGRIKVWQIQAGFQNIETNVVKDPGNKKKKKILNLNSLPLVATSKIHESSIEAACWMNTHQIITGSSDHSIGIVDAERLEIVRKLFTKDSITTQLDCSSGRVISSHEDGYIRLWDIREGTSPSATFKSHTKLASCVRFHRNHNVFASGAYDHTVKVWDCRSMFPLQNIGTHLDKVLSLCWKNENELASGGSDSKLVFHKIGGQ